MIIITIIRSVYTTTPAPRAARPIAVAYDPYAAAYEDIYIYIYRERER